MSQKWEVVILNKNDELNFSGNIPRKLSVGGNGCKLSFDEVWNNSYRDRVLESQRFEELKLSSAQTASRQKRLRNICRRNVLCELFAMICSLLTAPIRAMIRIAQSPQASVMAAVSLIALVILGFACYIESNGFMAEGDNKQVCHGQSTKTEVHHI